SLSGWSRAGGGPLQVSCSRLVDARTGPAPAPGPGNEPDATDRKWTSVSRGRIIGVIAAIPLAGPSGTVAFTHSTPAPTQAEASAQALAQAQSGKRDLLRMSDLGA